MQFKSELYEAVLLKRPMPFMVEAAQPSQRKMLLRCPYLGELFQCDMLGSRIWYSNSPFQEYLQTWELVEVDNGYFVSVNQEQVKELVLEGILHEVVQEISGYERYKIDPFVEPETSVDILLECEDKQCFINIEHVVSGDSRGEGYFPTEMGEGLENLRQLMMLREKGHRAILFYCVTHTGIFSLRPATHIDPLYTKALKEAINEGVEILAYRANITLENIVLSTKIPFVLQEDQLYLK